MSSVNRSYRQIDSNVKFFMCFNTVAAVGFTPTSLQTAVDDAVYAGDIQDLGSIINATEETAKDFIDDVYTAQSVAIAATTGNLYQDMGKTLYIQENGKNVLICKLVSRVDGTVANEGIPANVMAVPPTQPYYLPVWSAKTSIKVANLARTGF